MLEQSLASAFPMLRQGGVFLVVMGVAIFVGAIFAQKRFTLVNIGFGVGFGTFAFTGPLAAPYGSPATLQWASVVIAIIAQIAALRFVLPRFSPRGERAATIATLAIVGLHFALMAPAFGWPIVLLAALATVNALWGAWLPTYSLTVLWALDGVLKLSAGVVMLFSNLIPAWPRF
jgi:NO-binding membrane sensor protein with MHYT domain